MATFVPITHVDDPRVADYRSLRDAELRKRYEHRAGVFIAEGPSVVRALLASRYPTRSLLVEPRRAEELSAEVADRDVAVYVAPRDLIYEIVAFKLHQGAVACGARLPPLDPAAVVAGARRLLVLDAMNDHENMGALFRTGRALGADGVLLGPHSADPLYRRCVRVSMGHVLHLPFAPVESMGAALATLQSAGVTTVALTPDPSAPPIDDVDRFRPLALLLGAEGPGLAAATLDAADVRARIPMAPGVDSLNVSAAAAVALHALRC